MNKLSVEPYEIAQSCTALQAATHHVPAHVEYLDGQARLQGFQNFLSALASDSVPLQVYFLEAAVLNERGYMRSRSTRYTVAAEIQYANALVVLEGCAESASSRVCEIVA